LRETTCLLDEQTSDTVDTSVSRQVLRADKTVEEREVNVEQILQTGEQTVQHRLTCIQLTTQTFPEHLATQGPNLQNFIR